MQIPGLEWLEDEVRGIPGRLVDSVKTDIGNAVSQAVTNVRTDAANAVNQLGAAITSSAAGKIAPGGRQPVTIPLSSGQVVAVAIGLTLLVGLTVFLALRRR